MFTKVKDGKWSIFALELKYICIWTFFALGFCKKKCINHNETFTECSFHDREQFNTAYFFYTIFHIVYSDIPPNSVKILSIYLFYLLIDLFQIVITLGGRWYYTVYKNINYIFVWGWGRALNILIYISHQSYLLKLK